MDRTNLFTAISEDARGGDSLPKNDLEAAIEQQAKRNEIAQTMKKVWLELHKNKRQFDPDEITSKILRDFEWSMSNDRKIQDEQNKTSPD